MKNTTILTAAALLVAGTSFCSAAVYTWTGNAGTSLWGDSGNWAVNGSSNGYYPQSGNDSAVIGENLSGTITWTKAQSYFGETDEITLGVGTTLLATTGTGTGDLRFSVLNLYGTFKGEAENAIGFGKDFSVNFGDVSETKHGLFDFSEVTGTSWTNGRTVTVSANAVLSGEGSLDLFKFGATVGGGVFNFDTDGISVTAANGTALSLNASAGTLSDLSEGEYAFVKGSNSGLSIIYRIAAIPEPSAFGLLAGLGALALAGTRRRRKA